MPTKKLKGKEPVLKGDAEWEIIGKIALNLEQDDDGSYLTTDDFSTVYGEGKTPLDSIKDYWESLSNYYEILQAHAKSNRETGAAFRRLRRRLVKTSS